MNTKQLSKNIGDLFRLRPQPARVDEGGQRLPVVDDYWRLDGVSEQPARVRLTNVRTGQAVELESDNVQERRSPDFLLLRCELTLTPTEVQIEPVSKGAPIRPQPLPLARIVSDMRGMPLVAREDIRAGLVGARITISGELAAVRRTEAGRLRVGVMEESYQDVFFEVEPHRYPQLLLAVGGEGIKATGTVHMWDGAVELAEVEVQLQSKSA